MDIFSDVSASSMLVHAIIAAEMFYTRSGTLGDWQSKLGDLIISPSTYQACVYQSGKHDLPRHKNKQRHIKTISAPLLSA